MITGSQVHNFVTDMGPLFYLLIVVNIVLLVLAPKIIDMLSSDDLAANSRDFRINVLRGLNVLIVAILGHFRFYSTGDTGQWLGIKLLSILIVLYLSYLCANLAGRFVLARYGRKIQAGEVEKTIDSYASRGLSIAINVFIGIIALISIIRIAGFSGLLETGGVLGFVGVFLALTQGAWAPDVISGLIILNSKMFGERDVIKLSDSSEEIVARVHRTRVFHTELRHLVDNHRLMIRNSRIRDFTVHNLSRFGSARGLRETLLFKIGYDVTPNQVHRLFERAFEAACADESIAVEGQYPVEIRVQDTGDHAVEWSFHYYTKSAETLIKTRQELREIILNTALEDGIDLSTPITLLQQ